MPTISRAEGGQLQAPVGPYGISVSAKNASAANHFWAFHNLKVRANAESIIRDHRLVQTANGCRHVIIWEYINRTIYEFDAEHFLTWWYDKMRHKAG